MKKYLIILIFLIITLLVLFRRESFSPDTYVGDGSITYKKFGGFLSNDPGMCFINFEPFALSSEFSCTYSFSGLQPLSKYVDEYAFYLYIPPTTHEELINEATLQMTLHSNGIPVNSFKLQVNDLYRFIRKVDDSSEDIGDGRRKEYTKRDFRIPADPDANYELAIHYMPKGKVPENQMGYFYLSIGGEH